MNNAENTTSPVITPEIVRAVLACIEDDDIGDARDSEGLAPCAVAALYAAEAAGASWGDVFQAVDAWCAAAMPESSAVRTVIARAAMRGILGAAAQGTLRDCDLDYGADAVLAHLNPWYSETRDSSQNCERAAIAYLSLTICAVHAASAQSHGRSPWDEMRVGVRSFVADIARIGGAPVAVSLVAAIRAGASRALRDGRAAV